MDIVEPKNIMVAVTVAKPVDKVWNYWTEPQHIMKWNNASPDWHTPSAVNDLRAGGRFASRMEAKDGSFGFDFSGTYVEVKKNELISYVLDDDRRVEIRFLALDGATQISETFDIEETNPIEKQRFGWQCILDNFKKYTEMD